MRRMLYLEQLVLVTLVASVGLNELLHALSGVEAFSANVQFIGSVLAMSATPEAGSWRAINSPTMAVIAYTLIWLAHLASGVISLVAAYLLIRAAGHSERSMRELASAVAGVGVGIGCILYLLGLTVLAGGWFLLYHTPMAPKVIPESERLFLCYVAVLIYLRLVLAQRQADRHVA